MRAEWARAAEERDAAWNAGRSRATPVVDDKACESCGRTIARDQTLCNACSRSARDVVGDRKRAAWARAAAERDAAWHRRHGSTPEHDARLRRQIRNLALAVAGLVSVTAVLAVVLGGRDRPPPEPPATRIANAATFEQAIEIARPAFVDTTDELGEGAQLLAIYAVAKLRWSEVEVPPETTIRDVEPGRGKRLCATGEIQQITPRDLGGRKVHVGRLRTTEADEVAFVAVGTTGDLVVHSTSRLCGVVIGKSAAALSILGMFDLAENRRPLVERE